LLIYCQSLFPLYGLICARFSVDIFVCGAVLNGSDYYDSGRFYSGLVCLQ